MKAVVAREVSTLVLKPASTTSQPSQAGVHVRFDSQKDKKGTPAKGETTDHARYYGLITLNQITLTTKDKEVAGRMVELYFEVFREILGDGMKQIEEVEAQEGEEVDQETLEKVTGKVDKWRGRRKGAKPKGGKKTALESEELVETGDSKLVSAILTGINRALPYAKLDEEASVLLTVCRNKSDTLLQTQQVHGHSIQDDPRRYIQHLHSSTQPHLPSLASTSSGIRSLLSDIVRLALRWSLDHFVEAGYVPELTVQGAQGGYEYCTSHGFCEAVIADAGGASAAFHLWSVVSPWRG